MSGLLQRLGAFSARRRRLIVTLWVLLLAGLGVGSALADGKFTSNFSIPGTPSQDAIDLLGERLPAANGGSGRIVFAAAAGEKLSADQRAAIATTIKGATDGGAVVSASDPFKTGTVSKDGRIAFSEITFKATTGDLTDADRTAVDRAGDAARDAGLQVELSGDAAPIPTASHTAEAIGFAVALLVLAITFGSMLAAGMPLLAAAIGVGVGILGVTLVSAFIELSSSVIALATMLGLAVGIDYALFLISRHRNQVQSGMAVQPSIGHAVGTAGSAVVFAGATVIIALCALAVTGVPFLAAMGLAAASTVAIAVLINLTLVPALLGFAGARAVKGKSALATSNSGGKDTMGGRWGRFVVRHRRASLLVAVLVPLALAIPALDMRLGLPDDSTAPQGTTKRESFDLLKTGFGPGFSGPLTVIAAVDDGANAQQVGARLRQRIDGLDDIATVSPATVSPDKTLALIQVIPASGPSGAATERLVRDIRGLEDGQSGAQVLVTGQTAINIDISKRMSDSLVPYLAVVVGLALLLLMIAFRSILVPVTAIGGFLLTIAAALGALVAVFQQGFLADLFGVASTGAPLVSLIPILMIGILFGLAMDYQVFLVSGMKERHAHGDSPQDAVVNGFRGSARVVTAAGLIMISVFAGFIIPDDEIIKSIGFALAFGILIDAFLIRMTLIPALMSFLGERAWWLPRWLDRVLPNVDIEGANLTAPEAEPSRAEEPADADLVKV